MTPHYAISTIFTAHVIILTIVMIQIYVKLIVNSHLHWVKHTQKLMGQSHYELIIHRKRYC